MVTLSVFCRACGNHLEEEIDEMFPPGWLRCECGARYSLTIDADETRDVYSDTLDTDADAGVEEETLTEVESISMTPQEAEAAS